ncbi:hypothetical protein [Pyrococcus kukulkanii]|uniref:ATPase n=1 Tax=Pyrococcus kukulkanii TaxID=1609559 RepID=A0ABV4T9M4_9EURY
MSLALREILTDYIPKEEDKKTKTENPLLAFGLSKNHKLIYPLSGPSHRLIMGQTGAGKTTLAQTLMEIDFLKGRKVFEIEPALEAKSERAFMNLPNNDPQMLKVLKEYFGIDTEDFKEWPFKVVVYSPPTQRFVNFLKKHENDPGIEFFKPITFTEADLIDIIARTLPTGSIEGLIVADAYDEYVSTVKKRKKRSIEEFIELVRKIGEGTNVNIENTIMKINRFYHVLKGVEVDEGVPLKDIIKNREEISVFTTHFIERPEDRYIWTFAILVTVYSNWIDNLKRDYLMSFFIADANLLAPSSARDIIEKLAYFQTLMRQELQVYVKISRGKNMAWTLDTQRHDDLSPSIVSECKEWFIKRMYSKEFAQKLGLEPKLLRSLSIEKAIYVGPLTKYKVLIRPPVSRKAKAGEYAPIHFLDAYKRWENEEATF